MRKSSQGFSFAAILAILASIGVIIGVAYVAYDRFFSDYLADTEDSIVTTTNDDVVTVDDLPEAPAEVTDEADLDEVVETLDSVDLDASQLDAMESELDTF